jgi:hypothetical protein
MPRKNYVKRLNSKDGIKGQAYQKNVVFLCHTGDIAPMTRSNKHL